MVQFFRMLVCLIVLGQSFSYLVVASESEVHKGFMHESPALHEQLKDYPYKIICETYQNNNWELYVMNADGSNPMNLTNTPTVHEMYPHVSPDGTKVSFVSDEMQNGIKVRCVYYMNIDGTGRVKVADNGREPCWGGDSKSIAFVKSKYKQFQINDYATKGLYFYNLETKQIQEHPNKSIEHLYNICWSKNGKWIISTVHAGMGYSHGDIAIEVNGMNVYDLKIGGCRPDLSPDNKQLAWGRDDNTIAVADIDLETAVPKLTNIKNIIVDNLHTYHVDWSPDGKYLIYSLGAGGEVPESGPGTNKGIAEVIGVRGIWNLCISPSTGGGEFTSLTPVGETFKEPDWFIPKK
jgi:TolB protein